MLSARLHILKLKWDRWRLDRESKRARKQARERGDEQFYEDWYAEHRWKFEITDSAISQSRTRDLVRQALKYDVPIPDRSDEKKWEPDDIGSLVLTSEAMRELRTGIRKARRDSVEWWLKAVATAIGILTGLFLLISYLRPARKADGQSPSVPVAGPADIGPAATMPQPAQPGKSKVESRKPREAGPSGVPQISIEQKSLGPNSPNIIGSGNQVTINPIPPARRIPVEMKRELIAILSQRRGKIAIKAVVNDSEAYQFASDWYSLFQDAGWEISDNMVRVFMPVGQPWKGILMRIPEAQIEPNGQVSFPDDVPAAYLARCLDKLKTTSISAQPSPEKQLEMLIGSQPKDK